MIEIQASHLWLEYRNWFTSILNQSPVNQFLMIQIVCDSSEDCLEIDPIVLRNLLEFPFTAGK